MIVVLSSARYDFWEFVSCRMLRGGDQYAAFLSKGWGDIIMMMMMMMMMYRKREKKKNSQFSGGDGKARHKRCVLNCC